MNISGGVVGGALGGLAGALVWAGISYFTGYEIGWIAWGVGGLVGLGCVWGSKAGGVPLGAIAVVITLLSILAGKYAAVEFGIRSEIGSEGEILQAALAELQEDELVVSYLADEVVEQRQSQGETVEWPSGVNPEEASQQSDYPRAIWSEAVSTWEGMSPQEQQAYRDQIAELIRSDVQAFFSGASAYGFRNSFGVMDLLFFGLAVATAFRIAARGSVHDPEPDADVDVQQTET